jgi:hypothetical protein
MAKNINDLDKNGIYYLASPYTSKDKDKGQEIMKHRYLIVDEAGYKLMMKGFHLIEPIASTHHKAQRFNLPPDYAFWKERCKRMVFASDGVIVLKIDGWEESIGVQDEIKIANELGKPVLYIDMDEI